ncbi:coiled-coil domain-containing protein [Nocardiopsis lucentensis]|uniref:coiled-coil domain-containing protein n=1 Tax=Nocardiopsis lucentensis TaxID=53441 RepID=UPI000349EDF3|nr:hypothetical protein [Nocardiopsis lucentensis]
MQPDDPIRGGGASRASGDDPFADFWAPDPRAWTWHDVLAHLVPRAAGPGPVDRPARATAGALAVALAALLVAVPQSAGATIAPREPEDMDSLRARAESLTEEFQGELRDMEAVMDEAEDAEARAETSREEVEAARAEVRSLAVATYTANGIDPSMSLFVDSDPDEIIDRAVLIDYLSSTHDDLIDQLEQAMERDEAAQATAQEELAQVEADLDELEERRREVQRMIADHPNQPMEPPDNITPRTRQMRDEIISRFGRGSDVGGVGCYRAVGGWVVGEHPKGRACDFMVDGNGQMPSEDQVQRGYEIAEWAKENAEDFGIMYIIYRQEIWDIRRGNEGWRAMSDRGSVTENHFDHVHISMF